MDAFEIFDGFEKVENKLEQSPNMNDCTLLSIEIDEQKITVCFCDITNIENQKLCFIFNNATCTYLKFSNEFPQTNYCIWDAKVGQTKTQKLKFSVWDANQNSTGFPLLLEIEFETASVKLEPFENKKEREFFNTVCKAFKTYNEK